MTVLIRLRCLVLVRSRLPQISAAVLLRRLLIPLLLLLLILLLRLLISLLGTVCESGVRILIVLRRRLILRDRYLEIVSILKRVLVLVLSLSLVGLVALTECSTKDPLSACRRLVVLEAARVLLKLSALAGRLKEVTLCRNAANVIAKLLKVWIEKPCQFSWGEPRELLNAANHIVAGG